MEESCHLIKSKRTVVGGFLSNKFLKDAHGSRAHDFGVMEDMIGASYITFFGVFYKAGHRKHATWFLLIIPFIICVYKNTYSHFLCVFVCVCD